MILSVQCEPNVVVMRISSCNCFFLTPSGSKDCGRGAGNVIKRVAQEHLGQLGDKKQYDMLQYNVLW